MSNVNTRVIGLISGTSVDGIDAALVEISGTTHDLSVTLIQGHTYPYPVALQAQILAACAGHPLSLADLADLDDAIACEFAQAAIAIQTHQAPAVLIGSHGQTLYHRPPRPPALGYSLQLGRGALIAQLTGLTTISNFRVADIAAGGQGAPLVSPVDVWLLSHRQEYRCVQNLGGIGNVTYLPPTGAIDRAESQVRGWDTGPGNSLLDLAVQQLSQGEQSFDRGGAWAAQGTPCLDLVHQWLQHPFFGQHPPKSTGREVFGWEYLQQCLQEMQGQHLSAADMVATLTELTAASIADSYRRWLPHWPDRVLLCGGGSRNDYLRHRLEVNLPSTRVQTTDELGLSSDYKEAIAFAVLAHWRQLGLPGNLPEVTGARASVCLGEIHQGTQESHDTIHLPSTA